MSIGIGQILEDKYRIERLIGQGGMGAVYEGRNIRIERRVAIKVLHAAGAGDPEIAQRFEREAQAAGRIGNDHILEILDLGSLPSGDRYIVMEYLEGEALAARIARSGRLSHEAATSVMLQVLAGLGGAHAAGVVHRDLKPDNIFILREKAGRPDFVKIIDFGISKFNAAAPEMRMTRTGAVMGTPFYMSPEQVRGEDVDARSDLYSVGVILYEAVTGRVPFFDSNYNGLIIKIALANCPPVATLAPDLPPDFCAVVDRAIARERTERFQSAEEFAAALVQRGTFAAVPRPATVAGSNLAASAGRFVPPAWVETVPPQRRPSSRVALWGVLGVLGVGLIAAALLLWGGSATPPSASVPSVEPPGGRATGAPAVLAHPVPALLPEEPPATTATAETPTRPPPLRAEAPADEPSLRRNAPAKPNGPSSAPKKAGGATRGTPSKRGGPTPDDHPPSPPESPDLGY